MQILESILERKCKQIAKKHDCILLKLEGQRSWPDRLLLTPHGTMMFLEFKREGGQLSPLQRHTLEVLRSMNFLAEEVDNPTLFLALLRSLGVHTSIKNEV